MRKKLQTGPRGKMSSTPSSRICRNARSSPKIWASCPPRNLDLLTRCGVREVLASPAETALVPIQDYLGLDNRARINFPGRSENNWLWRLNEGKPKPDLADEIRGELGKTKRA